MKEAIIFFAKAPVYGKSKTRLNGHISEKDLISLSKNLMLKNYQEITESGYDYFVYTNSPDDQEKLLNYFTDKTYLQVGDELGAKMFNAINEIFSLGYDKILLTGSDIADTDKELFKEALDYLDKYDVISSPTKDGGFSLIAMKEPQKSLFIDKKYSYDGVFKDLQEEAKKQNLSFFKLRETYDIDDIYALFNHITEFEAEKVIEEDNHTKVTVNNKTYIFISDESYLDENNSKKIQIDPLTGVRYIISNRT